MATKIVEKMPTTELRRLIAKYKDDVPVTIRALVTVDMAADALSKNGINRPVRETHRGFLERQMRAGRWRQTHQGLAFSQDGELLDGQHRLLALTDYGQPLEFAITFNVPRESFSVIDFANLPRSLADVTGFPRKVLEPVAFFYREAEERAVRTKFDVEELGPYWAAYGDLSKTLMEFAPKARRIWSSAPIRAAAIWVAKHGGDDTEPFVAYRTLVNQEYAEMRPGLQSLQRQLMDRKTGAIERFVKAATAFERQDVDRVSIRDIYAKMADYRAQIKATADAHAKRVWRIQGVKA